MNESDGMNNEKLFYEIYISENELKALNFILDKLDDDSLTYFFEKKNCEIGLGDIITDFKRVKIKFARYEKNKVKLEKAFSNDNGKDLDYYKKQMSDLLKEVKKENKKQRELRKELKDV